MRQESILFELSKGLNMSAWFISSYSSKKSPFAAEPYRESPKEALELALALAKEDGGNAAVSCCARCFITVNKEGKLERFLPWRHFYLGEPEPEYTQLIEAAKGLGLLP